MKKPHAQARAVAFAAAHALREEKRGPVKGWQVPCVLGKRGGPALRLTMADLTPTISTGQDHGNRSRIDRGRHSSLPCRVDGGIVSLRGVCSPLRAWVRRRATDACVANDSRPLGLTQTRLGVGESSQNTPSCRARWHDRSPTSLAIRIPADVPKNFAIGRSGARKSWWHLQGPEKPGGLSPRRLQWRACASTGSASSSSGPRKMGDQRMSSPLLCLGLGQRLALAPHHRCGAKDVPFHLWIEALARNGAPEFARVSLDGWAPFSRDAAAQLPHAGRALGAPHSGGESRSTSSQ